MPMSETHHPIDPAVRVEIERRLAAVESDENVRVLYACESGSRGWGFASPDSDYDVRFLYVHPLSWYLRVAPQRDVIELPVSDELDINGWELRKALSLLKKGNATLIEWLDSPVVYRADARFLDALRDATRRTWQPERAFHHYLHMARGQYRQYLGGETVRLKKYLYALRPLLAALWVERGQGAAPMRFQNLVDGVVTDPALRSTIERLLHIKRTVPEREYGQPLPIVNAFIEEHLARLDGAPLIPAGKFDFSVLDQLLMDTIMRVEGRTNG